MAGKPKSVIRNPENYSGAYTKPWTCGKCRRVLSRLDALCRHMKMVHGVPYTRLDREAMTGYPEKSIPNQPKRRGREQ